MDTALLPPPAHIMSVEILQGPLALRQHKLPAEKLPVVPAALPEETLSVSWGERDGVRESQWPGPEPPCGPSETAPGSVC